MNTEHWRKRERIALLKWAVRLSTSHASRIVVWALLLEWARLGGKPDEVPGVNTESLKASEP